MTGVALAAQRYPPPQLQARPIQLSIPACVIFIPLLLQSHANCAPIPLKPFPFPNGWPYFGLVKKPSRRRPELT